MYQWPSVRLVDGAESVLRQLLPGRTIAVATGAAQSSEWEIRRAFARVGIDSLIHYVYCFANTGLHKPTPEFYRHILRDLNAEPDEVLMIGDSWE